MKKKLLNYLFLGSVFCFPGKSTIFAQEYKCGTTEAHQKLYDLHPELIQAEADYNLLLSNQVATTKQSRAVEQIYTIPVVFHILHTNGSENISDAQVIDQINILNRDWGKLNADTAAIIAPFQALAADMKIQFRLAQIDPNGNCTNGIDRIYSHKTENANDASKLNPWPREKYLNVWVIKTMESVGTAGYAYYPSATNPWYMEPFDGIIIIHSYIGSIGTASVGTSRALTHEVGHWLNLPHTWGSTNNPGVACGDEGVSDTPITKGHANCSDRYDHTCDSRNLNATYTFGGVTTSSGTTDPTAVPQAVDSSITLTNPIAVGLSANSASAGMFEFSGLDTGGLALNGAFDGDTAYAFLTGVINTGKYYEFTVTPDSLSNSLTFTGLTFNFQRNATGARTFAVRSSADGYASNLPASISPANSNLKVKTGNVFLCRYDSTMSLVGSKITLSGTINNSSRTFRIYGWNAEDSTGTFGIDNLTITGNHGIIENVENYMEYSYCSKMYTYEQKYRTRAALVATLSARNNLWINSNLIATGTDGTAASCAPVADFYANRYMICPGAAVTFSKNVSNITPGLTTTYNWSFDVGTGTPTLSTSPNPVITYNIPGMYNVTLTVSNTGGTGTITKNLLISVSDAYAQVSNTYVENFENSAEYFSRWHSVDLDNNSRTWWYSNSAGYSGTHSVMMNAYYNYAFDVDQLYSPSYDLTFITSPVLTFRCAAATKATTAAEMNDKLVVYTSTDCGATWLLKRTFKGAGTSSTSLINNSYHPEEFTPNASSSWALLSVPSVPTGPNVRFKFEYTSGNAGNSIYIDDVNMTGVLGIDNSALAEANISIYPNPTNQTSTLSYTLIKKGNVKIELIDVLGKKIMEANKTNQAEGEYTFEISKQELNLLNGIYFVKFSIDNTSITKKLVISE